LPGRSTKPRRTSAKRNTAPTTIAQHSISYIVTTIGEVLRTTPLDVLDVLITLTISSSNADFPHGISRNQVSRTLNVPLETVRRRVGALLKKRVIRERSSGLFVPQLCPLGALDNHTALAQLNAKTVRRMFLALKATGVRLG
jgi:hypothetical protein